MEQQIHATDIAAYLIRQCADENTPLTQLSLQKMLTLCQSLYAYQHNGQSMFPEPVEAWDKGPAVRTVWNLYHQNGSHPILHANSEFRPLPDDMLNTIAQVITETSHVSASRLIQLTHEHGTWETHHQPHGSEEIPVAELAKAWPEYHAAIPMPVVEEVDPTPATYRLDPAEIEKIESTTTSKRHIHFDFLG